VELGGFSNIFGSNGSGGRQETMRERIDGPDLTLTHNGAIVRHWKLTRVR
jgi:hypothetical protein